MFAEARGEAVDFGGHVAGCAIEMERETDDDAADIILANEGAQVSDVIAAIGARESAGGLRGYSEFVGESEADAFEAVIEREDAAGVGGGSF
jgi:hypothetical protein